MIIKAITASCLKDYQTITIGRQMEDNHRQFIFDCSGFDEEVTSIELVHQRSEDVAPYPVTTASTETLTWTVTDTDTAYAGGGRAELRIRFANGMAKTAVFNTSVIASITGDTVIPEPLESWYDALIDYIDDHAATPEQIEAAVEAYLEDHPIPAPVTSVNGKQGVVVLTATDVGAMPSSYTAPVTSVNTKTGDVVLTASDVGALSDQTTIPTKTSELTNDSGFITSAPVTSVNSKTGAVVLSAADVGAYTKPSGGIPKTDLTAAVQASLDKADTALQSAPVTSVNTKTGAVTLNASDVGALPSTYTAPVTSVDGKTGAVQIMPTGGTTGQVLTKTASGTAWQTPQAGGAVDSVNGQTGTVVLDASDVGALPDTTTAADLGAYVKPSGGIPKTDLASAVQTSLGKADTALQTAPVTSVNGQTGAVTGLAEEWTVQNMTASDTSVTLQTGKFYVFPTMASLAVTVTATGMYAFRFTSGATPTTLTVTGATMPDSFTVEANKVYEVNVYQGYGVVQSWS